MKINKAVNTATSVACGWAGAVISLETAKYAIKDR